MSRFFQIRKIGHLSKQLLNKIEKLPNSARNSPSAPLLDIFFIFCRRISPVFIGGVEGKPNIERVIYLSNNTDAQSGWSLAWQF